MNSFLRPRGAISALIIGLCVTVLPAIVLGTAGLLVGGCDDGTTEEADQCVGGTMIDGQCHAVCDPDRCLEGNVCVDNECRLVCFSHRDCDPARQACQPPAEAPRGDEQLVAWATTFGVCTDLPHHDPIALPTIGASCPVGGECTQAFCPDVSIEGVVFPRPPCDPYACGGQPALCQPDPAVCDGDPFCLAGKCEGTEEGCLVTLCEPSACRQPRACPNGAPCDPGACGGQPDLCQLDEAACGGDPSCTIGKCEGTDESCIVMTCDPSECSTLFCHGRGEGDATAYCSHDCAEDADCPAGYRCGAVRDAHEICSTCEGGSCSHDPARSCSDDDHCQKGYSFCGETDEPCIDPTQLTAGGRQYFEGQVCLMRRACLKREPCAVCQDNLDCSRLGKQLCVDFGGEKVCAGLCATDDDCLGDEWCMPTYSTCSATSTVGCQTPTDCPPIPCAGRTCGGAPGGTPCRSGDDCEGSDCIGTCGGWPAVGGSCQSSADCGEQQCLPRSACVPRAASCRPGTSPGGYCEHCVDDTDCGDAYSSVSCTEATDGQFACFDESFPDACPGGSDSECPTAPSGAHGECLDEAEGVPPGYDVYHRCYFPYRSSTNRFTCWP